MHRIDGPGAAAGNLFTEGNPSLSIPATVVTDDWANDVQEEIVNVILDQGISLVKGTQTQLLDAIKSLIAAGGDSQIKQAITNNQVAAADVVGSIYDKTVYQAVQLNFSIFRRDDAEDFQESGTLHMMYDIEDDAWRVTIDSSGDDAGVSFSVTPTGQLQYTSTNMSGGNHSGHIRIGSELKIKL